MCVPYSARRARNQPVCFFLIESVAMRSPCSVGSLVEPSIDEFFPRFSATTLGSVYDHRSRTRSPAPSPGTISGPFSLRFGSSFEAWARVDLPCGSGSLTPACRRADACWHQSVTSVNRTINRHEPADAFYAQYVGILSDLCALAAVTARNELSVGLRGLKFRRDYRATSVFRLPSAGGAVVLDDGRPHPMAADLPICVPSR